MVSALPVEDPDVHQLFLISMSQYLAETYLNEIKSHPANIGLYLPLHLCDRIG